MSPSGHPKDPKEHARRIAQANIDRAPGGWIHDLRETASRRTEQQMIEEQLSRDPVAGAVLRIAGEWRQEAAQRRVRSPLDPIGDMLVSCATEIEDAARQAASDTRRLLTVEEYARQPDVGVTPQTVRNWIRRGELPHVSTPKGYRIAPEAMRTKGARGRSKD